MGVKYDDGKGGMVSIWGEHSSVFSPPCHLMSRLSVPIGGHTHLIGTFKHVTLYRYCSSLSELSQSGHLLREIVVTYTLAKFVTGPVNQLASSVTSGYSVRGFRSLKMGLILVSSRA